MLLINNKSALFSLLSHLGVSSQIKCNDFEATENYVRRNSGGKNANTSDVVRAIFCRKMKDISEIKEYRQSLAQRGFLMDDAVLLRQAYIFSTKMYGNPDCAFNKIESLEKEDLITGMDDCKKGMEWAIKFLRDKMNIHNCEALSSPYLLSILGYYGNATKHKEVKGRDLKLIKQWVLTSNAKAHHTRAALISILTNDIGAVSDKNPPQKLLEVLRGHVGLSFTEDHIRGAKTNKSNALMKTMFLAFREGGAVDWNGSGRIIQEMNVHRIFPSALVRSESQEPNRMGNAIFITPSAKKALGNSSPAEALRHVINTCGKESLTSQCVPTDRGLWSNYSRFVEAREKMILNRINQFVSINQQQRNTERQQTSRGE